MNLKGDFFKHVKWHDICMLPMKILYIPEKRGYKVRYMYFNINAGKINKQEPHSMNFIDNLFIKAEDMKNWKVYTPDYEIIK